MSTPSSPAGPSKPSKPSKKTTVDDLRSGLEQLGLDTKGKKETLFRRWMNFLSRSLYVDKEAVVPPGGAESVSPPTSGESEPTAPLSPKKWGKQPIRSFLCFDVEATCREGREWDFPNEIIEFPVVLCRWREGFEGLAIDSTHGSRMEKLDVFHSYIRPTWRPVLSDFCTTLTGITQETVDRSPIFSEVLVELEKWLRKWDLLDEHGALKDATWVTDGPWDLRDFVAKQLHITPPKAPSTAYPLYFIGPYLDIKQAVQTYLSEKWRREQYLLEHPDTPPNARALSRISTSKVMTKSKVKGDRERPPVGPNFRYNIAGQIEKLGLGEFEGKQHSGIDDATNVSRILTALGDQDVLIETNGRLNKSGKRWPWMGAPGEVKWEEWMSTLTPLDSDSPLKVKTVMSESKKGVTPDSEAEVSDVSATSAKTVPDASATSEKVEAERLVEIEETGDKGSEDTK